MIPCQMLRRLILVKVMLPPICGGNLLHPRVPVFSSGIQVHDLVFPCDSKTSNNDETFSATLQSSTDEDDTYPCVVGSAQSLDVSDDDSDLSY